MLDGNFLGFGNVSTIIAGIDLYFSVLDLNKGGNGAVNLAVFQGGLNEEQIVAGIQLQSRFALIICGSLRKYRREMVGGSSIFALQGTIQYTCDIEREITHECFGSIFEICEMLIKVLLTTICEQHCMLKSLIVDIGIIVLAILHHPVCLYGIAGGYLGKGNGLLVLGGRRCRSRDCHGEQHCQSQQHGKAFFHGLFHLSYSFFYFILVIYYAPPLKKGRRS